MDASPEVLAQNVRAKRAAVDSDLNTLRVRLKQADPRRVDAGRWARAILPVAAGAGVVWWWSRHRAVRSLEGLLVHELRDLYAAEQQLVPALEKMSGKASNPELQQAFEQHCLETEAQVQRLERVFRSVGARPRRGASEAVPSIVAEGEQLLKRKVDPDVRDAWLIATAQRIEHLEIAGYGTARTFAETLGFTYAAELLQQSLDEERAADEKLTTLAERFINLDAGIK